MRYGNDAVPREQLEMGELVDALDRIRQRMTSYNIAPTQTEPVVLLRDSALVVEDMRWGWPNAAPGGRDHINARAETVHQLRTFASAFLYQRCLVRVDGWYEWKDGQPYLIYEPGGSWLAGLWKPIASAAPAYLVITKEASAHLAPIHHRMPAILTPEEALTWLDPRARPDQLRALLSPTPHPEVHFHPVTRNVGRNGYNHPDAIQPVEVAEQGVLAL